MLRSFLAAIALLSLSACTSLQDVKLSDLVGIGAKNSDEACRERTARWLDGIQFDHARLIDMEIRRGEFTPVVVRMLQNQTYILRLRNRDDVTRRFYAPEFFKNVAVAAVAIDNDIIDTTCPGPEIELLPGQTLELQLYAAVDGSYDFYDTSGLFGTWSTWESGGKIRIEQAE